MLPCTEIVVFYFEGTVPDMPVVFYFEGTVPDMPVISTRVLELHIILLPQSRYRDRNNENLIHGLSLYQSNSIVICLKVTPISFHEKCVISPVDMTSPDDEVITIRHTLHM